MTTPKETKGGKDAKKSDAQSPTSDIHREPNFDHNPQLEKAVNIAPQYPDPSEFSL